MTGQSLLDRMEVLNQELQLQPGEVNVTKGLTALNMSQDYFESVAAVRPKVLGSKTGTVVTAANTEYTAYPDNLLRIDRMQVLDSNSRPAAELDPRRRVGGHAITASWPLNLVGYSTPGYPRGYETSGGVIWWDPLPDAIYTVRWYGFQAASDITASGTFAYLDVVALPLAAFACRLLKLGVDDPTQDIQSLAVETFKPVLDTLSLFNRDGASGFEYTEIHNS